MERKLEVERTRMRIARDLHDDLSATLSSITYFTQAISGEDQKKLTETSRNYLNLISESATDSQEKIHDIIWTINSEFDSWEQLFLKLRRYAADLLDSQCIKYRLDIPTQLSAKSLGMEQRRNLWLIYKELLNNLVRHSKANQVEITLSLKGGRIILIVKDNGVGFDLEDGLQGNGIKNIRRRSEDLGGSCKVDTVPGEGTSWIIWF
jgi:signal transduction histidine kinase